MYIFFSYTVSYTYEIITMLPISKDIHCSKSLLSQSQLQGHMRRAPVFLTRKIGLKSAVVKKKKQAPPKTNMEPENDGF